MPDESAEVFDCDQCNRRYAWKPQLAGRTLTCKCGASITIANLGPVDEQELLLEEISSPGLNAAEESQVSQSASFAKPPPIPRRPPVQPPVQPPIQPRPVIAMPPEAVAGPWGSAESSWQAPPTYPNYQITSGRPGLITAIGVASVVVGLISILASGNTASLWRNAYSRSVPPPPPGLPAPLPAVTFGSFPGSLVRPDGLPREVRNKIIATLPDTGPLDGDNRAMFDRLLAEAGRQIYPGPPPSGALQLMPLPAKPRGSARFGFKNPGGPVKLSAVDAEFDSLSSVVTVQGDRVTAAGQSQWSVVAVEHRIDQLREGMPGITDMQAGFVADRLLNDRAVQAHEQIPVSHASLRTGNVLSINVSNNAYWVLPDGRSINKMVEPLGVDAATGRPLTVHVNGFSPLFPGDPSLMRGLYVYCLVVIASAIFLIVSGIVMMIRPAIGTPAHCWYILIKYCLIAAEISLSIRFFMSVSGSSMQAAVPFNIDAGEVGLISSVLFQAIYPTALLVTLLMAPATRAFITGQGGFVGLFSRNWASDFRRRWRMASGNPVARFTFGCLALAAGALLVAHLRALVHQSSTGPTPAGQIMTILSLACFGVAFIWFALRKSIDGPNRSIDESIGGAV